MRVTLCAGMMRKKMMRNKKPRFIWEDYFVSKSRRRHPVVFLHRDRY